MGDYAVHCALSGLAISYGQPVVAWKVQFGKLNDSDKFPPGSLPVFGFYDNVGGVVDEKGNEVLEGDGMVAICHRHFWDELRSFGLISKEDKVLSFKYGMEFASKTVNERKAYSQTEIYMLAHFEFGSTISPWSYLRLLDKIVIGEQKMVSRDQIYKEDGISYGEKCGIFEKIILDMIIGWDSIADEEKDRISIDMENLVLAYSMKTISGRPILATQVTHAFQYPEYKLESKWFSMVSKKSRELRSIKIKNRKE